MSGQIFLTYENFLEGDHISKTGHWYYVHWQGDVVRTHTRHATHKYNCSELTDMEAEQLTKNSNKKLFEKHSKR